MASEDSDSIQKRLVEVLAKMDADTAAAVERSISEAVAKYLTERDINSEIQNSSLKLLKYRKQNIDKTTFNSLSRRPRSALEALLGTRQYMDGNLDDIIIRTEIIEKRVEILANTLAELYGHFASLGALIVHLAYVTQNFVKFHEEGKPIDAKALGEAWNEVVARLEAHQQTIQKQIDPHGEPVSRD